jgi:hypothetical protein
VFWVLIYIMTTTRSDREQNTPTPISACLEMVPGYALSAINEFMRTSTPFNPEISKPRLPSWSKTRTQHTFTLIQQDEQSIDFRAGKCGFCGRKLAAGHLAAGHLALDAELA